MKNEPIPHWEEIVRLLRTETDLQKRQQLQQALGIALERAGFQNLGRETQPRDIDE